MATTGTNKQPLLIDRVFHELVDLKGATIDKDDQVTISAGNKCKVILDCTNNDGAIISELYTLGRDTSGNTGNITPWICNIYIGSSNATLTSSNGHYAGFFTTGGILTAGQTDEGEKIFFGDFPYILFPVPGVGSTDSSDVVGTQFTALYLPKGKCLWAGVNEKVNGSNVAVDADATTAPIIGVTGGFF